MKFVTDQVTGVLFAVPDRYPITPTAPGDCNAAVVSVDVANHAAGSGWLSCHTFAFNVVVPLPTACVRTRNTMPGVYVIPVATTDRRPVSFPDTVLASARTTFPVEPTCTFEV